MWTYEQATGWLFDDNGAKVDQGYSGNGEGLNNPSLQNVHDVGPIPQGHYMIGVLEDLHPKLGPQVMSLTPDTDNVMFGRKDFFIHGDNVDLDHTASEGCIILLRSVRELIGQSGDKRLIVMSGIHESIPLTSE